MTYVLGVDGGGTKTYAVIVDEHGNIAGKGKAGNGNHQLNYEEAKENIHIAVAEALNQAGIRIDQIARSCFGLAGADREYDFVILHKMLSELDFDSARYELVCDTIIGLRAGTDKPYGISLICGTGVNSAGRSPSGEIIQIGGFNYMYGDFGGGSSLSVEVFRSVIRAWDKRGEETLLTEPLLQELGYSSVSAMFNDYLDQDLQPPARLARLLFPAAKAGDAVAIHILRQQGEALAQSAVAAITRLGMEGEAFDVVLAGSILTRGEGNFVLRYIQEAVAAVAPNAVVKKLTVEPVIGALLMAIEATGTKVSEEVHLKLSQFSDFEAMH